MVKDDKNKDSSPSFIELVMYYAGFISIGNSIVYSMTTEDKYLWFSRLSLGIVSLGIAGIIRQIRKNGNS